jgi:parallel beta-helix repeat protein
MKRRTVLVGLGASAAGSGLAVGTGAVDGDFFSDENDASIKIADESSALLAMEPADSSPAETTGDDNELELKFTDRKDGKDYSVESDSERTFEDVFSITNNGTQDVGLSATLEYNPDSGGQKVESIIFSADGTQFSGDDGETILLKSGDSVGVDIKIKANKVQNNKVRTDEWTATITADADDAPPTQVEVSEGDDIGSAIDTVRSGGTVILNPGTYAQTITIDKPVTIEGPNSGIHGKNARADPINDGNPDETREDEAFIVPPSQDLSRDALITVDVEGGEVEINGLTLSGFDGFSKVLDRLGDPTVVEDIDPEAIGADSGILVEGGTARIKNNVFRAFGSYGVFGRGGMSTVEDNLLSDLPGGFFRIDGGMPSPSLRASVRLLGGGAPLSVVRNNTMTRTFFGVVADGDASGFGESPPEVVNNFIESERAGVRLVRRANGVTISENYLDSFRPESFQNAGIWVEASDDATITDNTIANSFSGVELHNSTGSTLGGTEADRCLHGIYSYNYSDVTRTPTPSADSDAKSRFDVEDDGSSQDTKFRNCLIGILAEDRLGGNSGVTIDVFDAIAEELAPGSDDPNFNDNGRAAVDQNVVAGGVEAGENATINDETDDDDTFEVTSTNEMPTSPGDVGGGDGGNDGGDGSGSGQ